MINGNSTNYAGPIEPTIKTNENTNRAFAESVVISEDIATYEWILESIQDIDSTWNINNLRIIFADGLITQTLLQKPRIKQTRILRHDY